MARKPRQLSFPEPKTWGGKRRGAGRPRRAARSLVPHLRRPKHDRRHPLHVTLRAHRGGLRNPGALEELKDAFKRLHVRRNDFRVLHYSLQSNHLHLIVEATDREKLSKAMQGLASALARVLNRALQRQGTVWEERYHAEQLTTPRQVRNALVYVLQNGYKHRVVREGLDWYSSAEWFDSWRSQLPVPDEESPVALGTTWLITVGWRRHGRLDFRERPR